LKYYPDTNEFSLKEFSLDYVSKIKHIFENLDEDNLEVVFNKLARAIESKKTIFTCGNGGSSSIAEHLVCDFVKGSSTDTNIDPKVFPLLNTPVITAIGNDIGYDDIFSYQIEKYAEPDDVLFCVSSSGDSPNIVKAIEVAKERKLLTLSFVGFAGGKAKDLSDLSIHIKSNNYGVVEDSHHILMHLFSQYLRLSYIDDKNKIGKIKF
tara:strand:+ start:25 stop:648 length:624 start_codon:yes stop_codon:yes gene_type:complete